MSLLEVKNLSISFGGLRAVDAFAVDVKEKELYGLIGPNGAGKTTVFNLLTGVYLPNDGQILLRGKSIIGKKPHEIVKAGIARTFQNIRLFKSMTVLENVVSALKDAHPYRLFDSFLHTPTYKQKEEELEGRAYELLRILGLDGHSSQLSQNLAYGQQRKLEIARALATDPILLLLDEPAAGMNPKETAELMETIHLIRDRFEIGILLIEHDMKLVSGICEKVTVLNFGTELCTGTPKEVLSNPEVIKAYLGA